MNTPAKGAGSASPAVTGPLRSVANDVGRGVAPVNEVLPNKASPVYASRWALFVSWCHDRGVDAVPADPDTLRNYLLALADAGKSLSTIEVSCAAIAKVHRVLGHQVPTSDRLRALRRSLRKSLGAQAAAIGLSTMRAIIGCCALDLRGTRDRALLLVTYFGRLHRVETTALDLKLVQREGDGYLLRLRCRGKGTLIELTPQDDPDMCPVRALDLWLRERAQHAHGPSSSPVHGPVFVALHPAGGHKERFGGRLHEGDVLRILKRRAAAAGLDPAQCKVKGLWVPTPHE